jgi:hypothetical protein
MIKKRLSLSLIALVGSVLLFIVTSFAWFTVSEIVSIGGINNALRDEDVEVEIFVSTDGINYNLTTEIDFQNQMPGDVVYYRVDITNNNQENISSQVSMYGFADELTDELGDDTNLLAGNSLVDVILVDVSNSVNANTIEDQTLASLLSSPNKVSANVVLVETMVIASTTTESVYFSLTFSGTAGNDYQNLALSIDNIFVQSFLQ